MDNRMSRERFATHRQPSPTATRFSSPQAESVQKTDFSPPSGEGTKRASSVFRRFKITGVVLLGLTLAVTAGVFAVARYQAHNNPPIPAAIKQKAGYVVFYPTDKTALRVDKTSVKYDSQNGLLSYVAYTPSNAKIIISEQATPDTFVDILSAYDQLIERLQGYSSFGSTNGKVSLTHPKELNGTQSAVMNAKGTLLFARPEKNLTDSDWRHVFNNLQALSK